MNEVLSLLIHSSIVSSFLILLIFMLRFVLKDKINKKMQYVLWLIVAVRLLVPFNYQYTLETQAVLPQAPISDLFESSFVSYESQTEDIKLPQSYLKEEHQLSDNARKQSHNILFIIWIAGVACILIVFGIRNISFRKKIMKSMTPYNFSDKTYDKAAKIAGLKHTIPVYLSKSLNSPCIVGIFHPVIVLTENVIDDAEKTKLALLHEMIHYKQKDNFFRLLGYILCAIYWFNPLVWLSAETARNDAELSCDSRVLQKLEPSEHFNYCYTLLSIAGNGNILVAAMSTGGRKMKKRIDLILKPTKKKTCTIVAVVICILLGIMSFININTREESVFSDNISLREIHKTYQLLTSLPNPNDNYKINTIVINNTDKDKSTDCPARSLYLGYELSKNNSIAGINDDDVQKINSNVLQLFSSISDLNVVTISYIDKQANSNIRNKKAPITYTYRRNEIENQNITPQIDSSFWESKGGNNSIIIIGYSEFYSSIGIKEDDFEKKLKVTKLFSRLGYYTDSWQSGEDNMYRFSPNPLYSDWSDLIITTDKNGIFLSHSISLSENIKH